MTTKVLLDTDIGSDIDDAICLAYLLAQPECQLLGITTVTGEGQRRAMMANALCRIAGWDVPVYIGAEKPLQIEQRQPRAPQADALSRWPHATEFPTGEAVQFLRDTIRANPHEVVLLTIGPLTNIGQLFAFDPEIPGLLKGLVMMGGVFLGGQKVSEEWNIMLDPHAANIVYKAKAPVHRSIGLDVTTQVRLSAAEVRQRFQAKLLRPVLDFAEVWFEERPEIVFHDPLAAVTLFDDAVCGFEGGQVTVEMEDAGTLGRTHWQPGAGPHEVATTVDAARFFEHYFDIVS